MSAMLYLESFHRAVRHAVGSSFLLPVFFVVTKPRGARRRWRSGGGRGLEMTHVATGWTVIDEFCARLSILFGISGSPLRVRAVESLADAPGGCAAGLGLWTAGQWRPGGFRLQRLAVIRWRWASPGRMRIVGHRHAAGAGALARVLALLRRHSTSSISHSSCRWRLPDCCCSSSGPIHDIGTDLAARHHRRHRRRRWRLVDRAPATRADFLFERPTAFWIAPDKARAELQAAE